ncbi:MAG: hypothetical protein ACUVWX_05325 [Kiritimatiellia bacterium]
MTINKLWLTPSNSKKLTLSISADEMKKALSAKFIGGKDVLSLATEGLVCNSIGNFLALLSIVFNSLRKVVTQDKKKLVRIQENIDRAVFELTSIE